MPRRPTAKPDDRPLLRIDEVAERLAISVRHVRGLRAEGRLPVVKIGRSIRVRPADVDRFIEEHLDDRPGLLR